MQLDTFSCCALARRFVVFFRFKKKIEHAFKAAWQERDGNKVSVTKPSEYKTRFVDFLKNQVFQPLPDEKSRNLGSSGSYLLFLQLKWRHFNNISHLLSKALSMYPLIYVCRFLFDHHVRFFILFYCLFWLYWRPKETLLGYVKLLISVECWYTPHDTSNLYA